MADELTAVQLHKAEHLSFDTAAPTSFSPSSTSHSLSRLISSRLVSVSPLQRRISVSLRARSHVELIFSPTSAVIVQSHTSSAATIQGTQRRSSRLIDRRCSKAHRQRHSAKRISFRFIRFQQLKRTRQETLRCRRIQYPSRRACSRPSSERAQTHSTWHPYNIRSAVPADRRRHRSASSLFLFCHRLHV